MISSQQLAHDGGLAGFAGKLAIPDITPVNLASVDDQEILSLHHRLHQLWGLHFEGNTEETTDGLTREDLVNAHGFILIEFESRGLNHNEHDGLDKVGIGKAADSGQWAVDSDRPSVATAAMSVVEKLTGKDLIIVPSFVSIAGSSVIRSLDVHDIDVIVRADHEGHHLLLNQETVILPIRKALDPGKEGYLHLLANPVGPHSDHIPIYDLVLRQRSDISVVEIKMSANVSENGRGLDGLYLVEPHASMIASGEKKAVIKSRRFDLDRPLVLVTDQKALGLILFDQPRAITLEEFEATRDEHRVSDAERQAWWPGTHELYLYSIKRFVAFAEALPVEVPQGVQTIVRDVIKSVGSGQWTVDSDQPPAAGSQRVKIDLGCGASKPEGYFGVDWQARPGVDLVWDILIGLPFPDDYADEIRAHHSLEHIADPVWVMSEIWRVLKPGGKLDAVVPSTEGQGAFAHPGHRSYWNRASFAFYSQPELIEEIGFPGRFKILRLEDEDRGETIWTHTLLEAIKDPSLQDPTYKAVAPWYAGPLPKPAMKIYFEFFSVDELWERWAKARIERGLIVEEKLNGFRALVQKKGAEVRIHFEDARTPRQDVMPDLVEVIRQIDGDVIVDSNIGVDEGGKPWPRIKLMTLTAKEPKLPGNAFIVCTAFDLLYWNEDLTGMELTERRNRLERLVGAVDEPELRISRGEFVQSRNELEAAARKYAGLPGSEGIVVKVADSPYPLKVATNDWSKVKHAVEVKARVLEVKRTKAGTYNFRGGLLRGSTSLENLVEVEGETYIDLGFSFNSTFSAEVGDIVTFQVEEIILQLDGTLAWLGALPLDVDKSRTQPYFANQVIDLARRGRILQDARKAIAEGAVESGGALVARATVGEQKLEDEGETRSERAERFWSEHWQESFPPGGEGEFVYHHHWRGLNEDEARMNENDLLETTHSVHGDLRCSFGPALWGFSIFLGETRAVREAGGDRFENLPHDDALQGAFKLHQPVAWLTVGRPRPFVAAPGGVGSTSLKFSKFFALDWGAWQVGVWHKHFFEVFLQGKRLKGRIMIMSVPRGRARVWQIVRPEDQTPLAESKEREALVKERKKKRDQWLVWARPGEKPELINLNGEKV